MTSTSYALVLIPAWIVYLRAAWLSDLEIELGMDLLFTANNSFFHQIDCLVH